MDNAEIARTLDAYAALLDLAGAATWSIRAYRRAADLIRTTPAPVEELVRTGRARDLRGIGPGIERRLRELVETGRIAELEELEREVEPELVALGRYLGLGPQRLVALGRALGIRSADELRAAAAEGRLREAPGVGPATEAKILEALSREPQPARRGLTRNRAFALADAIAAPLGAVVAGELRRGCELVHRLVLVSQTPAALEAWRGCRRSCASRRSARRRRRSSRRRTSAATSIATRRGPMARRRCSRWRRPHATAGTSTSPSATTRRT